MYIEHVIISRLLKGQKRYSYIAKAMVVKLRSSSRI